MQGIKSISSYSNPGECGYTECIETAAGKYFVRADTGEIVGAYVDGKLVGDVQPDKLLETTSE